MVILLLFFFCLAPLTELYSFWYGLKKDFYGNFSGQCNMVIFFVCFAPLTDLYPFWYGLKDLFTLHKLADKS